MTICNLFFNYKRPQMNVGASQCNLQRGCTHIISQTIFKGTAHHRGGRQTKDAIFGVVTNIIAREKL
jgi:hypothetical protein